MLAAAHAALALTLPADARPRVAVPEGGACAAGTCTCTRRSTGRAAGRTGAAMPAGPMLLLAAPPLCSARQPPRTTRRPRARRCTTCTSTPRPWRWLARVAWRHGTRRAPVVAACLARGGRGASVPASPARSQHSALLPARRRPGGAGQEAPPRGAPRGGGPEGAAGPRAAQERGSVKQGPRRGRGGRRACGLVRTLLAAARGVQAEEGCRGGGVERAGRARTAARSKQDLGCRVGRLSSEGGGSTALRGRGQKPRSRQGPTQSRLTACTAVFSPLSCSCSICSRGSGGELEHINGARTACANHACCSCLVCRARQAPRAPSGAPGAPG